MSRIDVLLACIPTPGTRFLDDWKQSLGCDCNLLHDHSTFWDRATTCHFDIVHIHWPEYLSFELESALLTGLRAEQVEHTRNQLEFWKSRGSRIVIHRHNVQPHADRYNTFPPLYEAVYSLADAVIHMGQYSRQEFAVRYPDMLLHSQQSHVVIPHGNFASYPNTASRESSRQHLNVRQNASVVVVFGGFACDDEQTLVLDSFRKIRRLNKTLLVPNWKDRLLQTRNIRLKYLVRDFSRWYHRIHPCYKFSNGFVPDDDVQHFLNASDVLLVQRKRSLNSGNLVLGFSFGRVVVGPDEGNVGEILRATGNPVFDPGCSKSAARALERGLQLSREGLGQANRDFAIKEWDVSEIGQRCIDLYRTLLKKSPGLISE